MYQVTVQPLLLSSKDTFRQIIPMLSWTILFFVMFALTCIFDLYLLAIPLLLEAVSILPIGIWSVKRAKKIREESLKPMAITVISQNGKIYKNNIELNLLYAPSENIFYIDNARKSGKCKLYRLSFSAIITGNEAYRFAHFCLRNNVQFNTINETN